jgi:hypothetical protein
MGTPLVRANARDRILRWPRVLDRTPSGGAPADTRRHGKASKASVRQEGMAVQEDHVGPALDRQARPVSRAPLSQRPARPASCERCPAALEDVKQIVTKPAAAAARR